MAIRFLSGQGVTGVVSAFSFVSTTDSGININGITLTRVAANSAIRVGDGLETLGLLRSYAALAVGTTGTFGGNVTVGNGLGAVTTDGILTINGGSGTGGEAYLRLMRGGTAGFILNHTASAIQVRATANIPMFFYTNDTLTLKINANNTLSLPTYGAGYLKTDGSGNVTADSSAPGTGVFLPLAGGTMTGVTQFNDHTQHGDQVQARWGADNDLTIEHNGTHSFIQNDTGNLQIEQHANDKDILLRCDDGSGGLTSYLVLDGSTTHAYFSNPGNVGINETSPSEKLHVDGNIRVNSGTQGYYGSFIQAISGSGLKVGNDDFSGYAFFDDNGNVGIGTTNPSTKLHVVGSAGEFALTLQNTSNGDGLKILTANQTANNGFLWNQGSSNLVNMYSSSTTNASKMIMLAGGVDKIFFNTEGDSYFTGGNVGIGMTTPRDKLNLFDAGDNVGMYFHTTTSGTAGGDGLRVGQNNANAFVWNYEATSLAFATSGTARLTINASGGVRFNTGYGAGTLVTDASGNISVSSGGGAGGPYLPLAGGTMDSGATITTSGTLSIVGNSAVKLRVSGGARIQLENANVTDSFYISNTGGNLASTLDLGGTLSIIEGGAATFAGDVLVEDNLYLTDAGTVRGKLILNASDRDNVELRAESLGSTMKFFTVGTQALLLDASQNATFAKDVILSTDSDILKSGTNPLRLYTNGTLALSISASQNATVTGNLTVNGTSSTFNTGNSGTFVTNDGVSGGYPRITTTSSSAQLGLFRASDGGFYIGADSSKFRIFNSAFGEKFSVDTAGNVLAIGEVKANTHFTSSDTNVTLSTLSDGTVFLRPNGRGSTTAQSTFTTALATIGTNVAVTGAATATTATTSTDNNATLTTKGYVDGLVTGVPVYKGTWDASGTAGGTPDLRLAANKVLGNYYIVSTAGSATPNGTGVEPNSWNVGDWCIFSDVTPGAGTDLWQKIDNTSVISGAGTGQSVTKWEGTSGAASETLTDGPITFSTNDSTFAGKVITTEIESASTLLLDAAADITIDAGGGDIILSDDATIFGTISSSGGMQIRSRVNNGDMFLRGVDNGTEFNALTLDMSEGGNATFAGDVEIRSGNKLILQRPNNAVATEISTDSTGAMILDSLNSEGFFFNNNGTNAFKLDHINATFAGTVTSPTFLGDLNGTINTATTGTTQTAGNNSTLIATTAYADAAAAAVPIGNYLPLTAGSTKPLTGDLYVQSKSLYITGGNQRIYMSGGSATNYRGVEVSSTGLWSWGETGIGNYFSKNVGIGITSNSAEDTNNGVPKFQVTTTTAVLGEFPLAARFTTGSDAGDNSGVSVLINSGNDRGLMISAGRAESNRSRANLNLVSFDGNELIDGITLYMPNTGSTGATTGTNVGIGTATPQKKLHIEGPGGASVSQLLVTGASDTVGSTAGILLRAESGESDSALRAKGGIFFERTATNGLGKLHFANNGSNNNDSATLANSKMTILSDGKVGIGTSSPFATATNNTGLNVDSGGHSSIQIGDGINDGGMIQSSDNSQRIIIGANVYDSPTGSWQRFTADGAALVDVYGEGNSAFISLNVDAGTSGFPEARLTVSNTGGIKFNAYSGTAKTGAPTFLLGTDASGNVVKTDQNDLYNSRIVLIDTPNGGLKECRVISDEYGEWIVVGRFAASAMNTIQSVWSSVSGLSTGTAQNETTQFSADFGDSYPSEVRIMGSTDFTQWRPNRTIDWVYKVPTNRPWKFFFSNGATNGMATVDGVKQGWTVNGAYDGFGRWTNSNLVSIRMSDIGTPVLNPSAAYTTATTNAFNWETMSDAKFSVSATRVFCGQDTFVTSGVGNDDNVSGFFDVYPGETNNMGGGQTFSSAVWVLIKLPKGANAVPYLPLAGGTMTGTNGVIFPDNFKQLYGTSGDFEVYYDGTDAYVDNYNGDLIIKNRSNDKDIIFQSDNGSGGLSTYFQLDGSAADGTYTYTVWGDNDVITLGSGFDMQIHHDGSNSYIQNETGNLTIFNKQDDGDVIFATDNGSGGTTAYLTLDGSITKTIASKDIHFDGAVGATFGSNASPNIVIRSGLVTATTFSGDLNGTINTATTGVTQANGIDNTTIATTAYVNNKIATIPAGLVFQGTWNASTNTPTLASGTGTTGHFYIVSTSGSTNLDGVTDWVTGDWAVFIEQGGTDAWEKIDNSSVLDGAGTGQTVALWSGSGTSNTLTNAPITVSGNNATFAGNVALTGGSLSISGDGSNAVTFTESSAGIMTIAAPDDIILDAAGDIALDAGGDDIRLRVNGTTYGSFNNASSNLNIYSSIEDKDIVFIGDDGGTAITALTLDMSNGGSATFRDDIDLGGKITQTGTGINTFPGSIKFSNNIYRIEGSGATRGLFSVQPHGGDYYTQTSTETGYLKITLPVDTNVDDMVKFTLDVYLYGNDIAMTAHLGGYLTSSLNWGNTTATIVAGNAAQNYAVRFGNDGTDYCVYIGESDTAWSYPQMVISNFFAGYGAVGTDDYLGEWTINFTTSLGTISDTQTNNFPLSSGGTSGAFLPLAGGTMTLANSPLILPQEEANAFKIQFQGASSSSGISTVDQSGSGLFIGANSRVNNSGVVVTNDTLLPTAGIYFDGWSDDEIKFFTSATGSPVEALNISSGGNATFAQKVSVNTTVATALLNVGDAADTNVKVTRIAGDTTTVYQYGTQADAVLEWTCGSYHNAEVVITSSQTNGGSDANLYIRGIWSNNHTAHHWRELENVGSLPGTTFTITNGQNGSTTNSGRLTLTMDYTSGSFATLNVRITDFFGSHSYTIT